MAQTVNPAVQNDQTSEQPVPAHVAEARALRREFLEEHRHGVDDDASPQAFYERSVRRPDIREILKQLAKS